MGFLSPLSYAMTRLMECLSVWFFPPPLTSTFFWWIPQMPMFLSNFLKVLDQSSRYNVL